MEGWGEGHRGWEDVCGEGGLNIFSDADISTKKL